VKSWPTALLALSGLVPLLGLLSSPPEVMLLLYTVFVGAWLVRNCLARGLARLPGPKELHLVLTFLLAGVLTESLAWGNNYLKAAPEPALFHPQLIPDLIIGFGFYGGWAFAWMLALRWFKFSRWEPFVITGVQGIFFEQLGAVFRAMLQILSTQPFQAIFFGVYVFAVHGAAAALGLVAGHPQFDREARGYNWLRFPVILLLMVSFAFAGCWIVGMLVEIFGGLPEKRSITEHLFW
jgi:hypothetical protein